MFMNGFRTPIEVPEEGIHALECLLDLGADGITAFCHAFTETGPTLVSAESRAALLQEAMSVAVETEDIERIISDVLHPLNTLRDHFDVSPSGLYSLLAFSLDRDQTARWTAERRNQWNGLKDVLIPFFGLETAAIERKAFDLLEQRPAWVQTLRIFSDERPVFDEAGERITASVLVNTLRVQYANGNSRRTAYLSLDPNDLDLLEVQIQRARRKNRLICQRNERNGIPTLMLSPDDGESQTEKRDEGETPQ